MVTATQHPGGEPQTTAPVASCGGPSGSVVQRTSEPADAQPGPRREDRRCDAEQFGVRSAREMAGRGQAEFGASRSQGERWELRAYAAVTLVMLAALLVTVIQRTGNDPFVDVPVPAERVAGVQIDLNTAGWHDLLLLEGVGETLARRIVAHREEHGPLRSVDDLTDVPGIGPKKLAGIRRNVTIGGTQLTLREDGYVPPPEL